MGELFFILINLFIYVTGTCICLTGYVYQNKRNYFRLLMCFVPVLQWFVAVPYILLFKASFQDDVEDIFNEKPNSKE